MKRELYKVLFVKKNSHPQIINDPQLEQLAISDDDKYFDLEDEGQSLLNDFTLKGVCKVDIYNACYKHTGTLSLYYKTMIH